MSSKHSRSPRRPRRALLVCYELGPHDHTGGFRWRSMVDRLGAHGWSVDVLAADGAGPSPDGREPSGAGDGEVFRISPRWPVERLRAWRRERYIRRTESRASESKEPESPGSESPIDPRSLVVEGSGQPLGVVEALRSSLLTVADLADGLVWTARAARRARQLAARRRYDVVVSTSPPHLTHRVAADLARRAGVPMVADFRDPWYFGRGPAISRLDPLARWLWRRLERRALGRATAAVDIAEAAQRDTLAELRRAPRAAERRLAAVPRFFIPSGYEPGPVGEVDGEVFRIVYTGWLWPFMPLPSLLEACGRLRRRLGLGPTDLRLELVGVEPDFGGASVLAAARGAGLEGCVVRRGRVARREAARLQERAAVSVAFDSVCAHGLCIPSKLYHCARCRGELLPIGRLGGAMAEEAAKIGVETVAPEDMDGLVRRLEEAHRRWRRGEMTERRDPNGVFDARRRGDEMAALLDAVARGADLRRFDPVAAARPAPVEAGNSPV